MMRSNINRITFHLVFHRRIHWGRSATWISHISLSPRCRPSGIDMDDEWVKGGDHTNGNDLDGSLKPGIRRER